MIRFFVLSLVIVSSVPVLAQQNAGPLNAAPGAPNQDPAQPNIATETKTIVNRRNRTPLEGAVEACANLARGAHCEVAGINRKKLKGRCQRTSADTSTLSCMTR